MDNEQKVIRILEIKEEMERINNWANRIYRQIADKESHKIWNGYYELKKELKELEGES